MTYLYNRVLLTNDDGIDAPGIKILENIASKIAREVWVVAPECDQSGTSQSVSIHHPLRVSKKDSFHFAVSGTPVDSVVVGLRHIMPELPDIVLSGVNRGSNLGLETMFSGTVGAATAACLLNVPAIAFSQNFTDGKEIYWETAYHHGQSVLEKLFKLAWQKEKNCLNINFPDCPYDEVKSIEFTSQGIGYVDDINVVEKIDLRDNSYYWINFNRPVKQDAQGTETQAINDKNISITPLSFNRTHQEILDNLKKLII